MINDLTKHRAFITGATGFIGSHLTYHLRAAGWEIGVLVRPTSDVSKLHGLLPPAAIQVYDSTYSCIASIIDNTQPEIVFHLSSHFRVSHRPEDIASLIDANISLGSYLAEAMIQLGVRKLVNVGSSWQHYQTYHYSPVNLYAATKQAFEDILQFYVEAHELRAITLKLFDTYGPADRRKKLFQHLKQAALDQPVAMSPGDQLIDLVYVGDVVEALVLAAQRLLADQCKGHEEYAVCSGNPLTLREIVAEFERQLGRKLPIEWGGRPYREREVMKPWEGRSLLPGWKPRVSLEDGIARCLLEMEA